MLVFLSRQFQMKTMQETMKQRSEKYAGDYQDNQAGIKRVERGENLTSRRLYLVNRSHATQDHRCIQKSVYPSQTL